MILISTDLEWQPTRQIDKKEPAAKNGLTCVLSASSNTYRDKPKVKSLIFLIA